MSASPVLPWQGAQWTRLWRARETGHLPHALLLRGPAGVGKQDFAERLAAGLLCQAPGDEGAPCGRCRSCRLRLADTHPDLRRIAPPEPGKAITVDRVRAFCDHNISRPQLGEHQLVLLHPAEAMNSAAANAFLKTLEEPVGDAVLILASSNPERLPATIRSRCQALDFPAPGATPEVLAWLAGDADQAAIALAVCAGAPLRARAQLDAARLERRARALTSWLAVARRRADPVAVAEEWLTLDDDWLSLWWRGWLLDLAALAVSAAPPRLFNPDRRDDLQALAKTLDLARLHRLLDQVARLATELARQLNRQLLFERLLIESTTLQRR